MAAFAIEIEDDVAVGPATILLAFVPVPGPGTDTGPVDELTAATVVDVVAPVAVATEDTAVVRLCESSLCHLALLCKAALICVHSSFLQDFDLI